MDQGNKPVHPTAKSQALRLHTYHIELSAPDSLSPSVRHQLDRLLWLQAWHGNSRPATKMIDARQSFLRRCAELSGLLGNKRRVRARTPISASTAQGMGWQMADGRPPRRSWLHPPLPLPPQAGMERTDESQMCSQYWGTCWCPYLFQLNSLHHDGDEHGSVPDSRTAIRVLPNCSRGSCSYCIPRYLPTGRDFKPAIGNRQRHSRVGYCIVQYNAWTELRVTGRVRAHKEVGCCHAATGAAPGGGLMRETLLLGRSDRREGTAERAPILLII